MKDEYVKFIMREQLRREKEFKDKSSDRDNIYNQVTSKLKKDSFGGSIATTVSHPVSRETEDQKGEQRSFTVRQPLKAPTPIKDESVA